MAIAGKHRSQSFNFLSHEEMETNGIPYNLLQRYYTSYRNGALVTDITNLHFSQNFCLQYSCTHGKQFVNLAAKCMSTLMLFQTTESLFVIP